MLLSQNPPCRSPLCHLIFINTTVDMSFQVCIFYKINDSIICKKVVHLMLHYHGGHLCKQERELGRVQNPVAPLMLLPLLSICLRSVQRSSINFRLILMIPQCCTVYIIICFETPTLSKALLKFITTASV